MMAPCNRSKILMSSDRSKNCDGVHGNGRRTDQSVQRADLKIWLDATQGSKGEQTDCDGPRQACAAIALATDHLPDDLQSKICGRSHQQFSQNNLL